MIRRELRARAGAAPGWLLISQLDHAALAGHLAEAWGAGDIAALAPREDVLFAVERHDEGWRTWEERPLVDPRRGWPYDFLEMPLDHALPIWSASIDFAEDRGPLPAWLVSSHFSALLKLGLDHHSADLDYVDRAIRWLTAQGQCRREWLARLNEGQDSDQLPVAERGLAHLQLFDRLSLWFCCDERTQPARFATPGGPEVDFRPRGGDLVAVSPWPFWTETIHLKVSGRRVEARPYHDAEDLAAANGTTETLAWTLSPG